MILARPDVLVNLRGKDGVTALGLACLRDIKVVNIAIILIVWEKFKYIFRNYFIEYTHT